MFKGTSTKAHALVALILLWTSGSAVAANISLTINNAIFTDLYSDSLDASAQSGPLPNPSCDDPVLVGEELEKCQFFTGVVPASPRAVAITNNGYNAGLQNGTLDVEYDAATGEITQVNTLEIFLQDLTVEIFGGLAAGGTTVEIINGNGIGSVGGALSCTATECTPGMVANDQIGILAGITARSMTADPDQAVTNNDANIFHHNDGVSTDTPDFSTFLDVTDTCAGFPMSPAALCNLVFALNIDAVRYRIEGNILAGPNFTLIAQTPNTSTWTVEFTAVPVPAAVWLFGSALGLLGFVRRRMA